jgi:hypothetical protein
VAVLVSRGQRSTQIPRLIMTRPMVRQIGADRSRRGRPAIATPITYCTESFDATGRLL